MNEKSMTRYIPSQLRVIEENNGINKQNMISRIPSQQNKAIEAATSWSDAELSCILSEIEREDDEDAELYYTFGERERNDGSTVTVTDVTDHYKTIVRDPKKRTERVGKIGTALCKMRRTILPRTRE